MDDLNDLSFFVAVVHNNGFSAAARATGVEKTRLSRRVAALERRVGVRLLQRSTRTLALTEAGARFYAGCVTTVESAQATYESLAELRREPSGTVRLCCPVVMAQSYLAPLLPGYLAGHPKVNVLIEASDRTVNLIEERFDLALRVRPQQDNEAGLVAKSLGIAKRILVAAPRYLAAHPALASPDGLSSMDVMCQFAEQQDGLAHWVLSNVEGRVVKVKLKPRLVTTDLRLQHEAALHGIGVALLPEPIVAAAVRAGALQHVLADWSAPQHLIRLVYPTPRGMLPSVRSLIEYLSVHLPIRIQESGSRAVQT